jgi:hypothetical protein
MRRLLALPLVRIAGRRPIRPGLRFKAGEAIPNSSLLGLDVEARGAQIAPAVENHHLPSFLRVDAVLNHVAALAEVAGRAR